MGNAGSSLSEEEAATKLQAVTRGRQSRHIPAGPAAPPGPAPPGYVTVQAIVAAKKGGAFGRSKSKMGIELSEDNVITALGAPANKSDLRVGDLILSVDGFVLGTQLLSDVLLAHGLVKRTEHVVCARRPPPS